MKTGQCFFRDEAGTLRLAESFEDDDGVVTSTDSEEIEIQQQPIDQGESNV